MRERFGKREEEEKNERGLERGVKATNGVKIRSPSFSTHAKVSKAVLGISEGTITCFTLLLTWYRSSRPL